MPRVQRAAPGLPAPLPRRRRAHLREHGGQSCWYTGPAQPRAQRQGPPSISNIERLTMLSGVIDAAHGDRQKKAVADALNTEEGAVALAAAAEAVHSGNLTLPAAQDLIIDACSHGAGHAADVIRIFALLRPDLRMKAALWAVNGLREADLDGPATLTTGAEAEAAAALTKFTVEAWLEDDDARFVTKLRRGGEPRLITKHTPVGDLVRRRPADADRIRQYLLERSSGGSCPEIADIEAWLDFGVTAVSSGLL